MSIAKVLAGQLNIINDSACRCLWGEKHLIFDDLQIPAVLNSLYKLILAQLIIQPMNGLRRNQDQSGNYSW